MAGGDALLSPSVTRKVLAEFAQRPGRAPRSDPGLALLTERERGVVAVVAEGLSNEEIAARLVISPATARTHVSRAMAKLRARDRAQLVVFAYRSGTDPLTPSGGGRCSGLSSPAAGPPPVA